MLEIKNLHVEVNGKEILKGIDLEIGEKEIHAIMGPNGSGKSSLALTIMGHPDYRVVKGDILFKGKSILNLETHERARLGIFLAFQYPMEISINTINFLKEVYSKLVEKISIMEMREILSEKLEKLKINPELIFRNFNQGSSGGERKKLEILQLSLFNPKLAILDESDTGLDIDSLRIVSNAIKNVSSEASILLITHYQRILNYVKPDFVHILINGKIVKSGDSELAKEIEEKGYESLGMGE